MKKRQCSQKEAPSKVLLVCVYDTVIIEVTNEVAFARFSPFGTIIKILIFERGEVTKFFLEYMLVQDAVKAKNFLDGSKLYESICKMNIYYSNFASVDLKHETSEGVSLETPTYASANPYYYYPHNYYNYPYLYNPNDQFVELAHSFNTLSLDQKNTSPTFYSPSDAANWEIDTAPQAGQNLSETIQSNIDWLLRSQEKKTQASIEENHKESQEKSCFLHFQLKDDLSNRNIYNLFSNFGNISYIKKTRKAVYIKFRTIEFANMAKNYLQGFTFLGNDLNLAYLSNRSEAEPKEEEYSEITYFDASFDRYLLDLQRFTSQKSITINPPCSTLHLSSLKRQSCRTENLRYIFEEFGPVEAVEILGSSYDKNMALIKFKNIEDSFYALAEMHNRAISGRKVQISFTKSQIYQPY